MVISRSRLLLRCLLILSFAVAAGALPWSQRTAHADTATVCLRSQVPAGWVIIAETFVASCSGDGYLIALPAADGTATSMCRGNLANVPRGFVIVGESRSGRCTSTILSGTWLILKPLADGTVTEYCKGNLAGVPSGFVIVGEARSSPCTSFSGTWAIRTPDPVGLTVICRVGLAQIPAGYHTVGGTTSGGPCSSFNGTWLIAPN